MKYRLNQDVKKNVEVVEKPKSFELSIGYLVIGGIGIVGYMLGSRNGFKRGLTNPVVKSYVEKIDYSDVGKIIARTITQTFGYSK